MTKYKAYPGYKDSGVEWLGAIPSSWQMWKLSHTYEVIGSGTTPTSNNESYFQGDIPWVTTGELREKIIYDTDKKVKESTLQIFSALKIHPAGSVVIAMYGATIGRLGILGVDATTNQACCVMTKSKIINNQYLYYWLQAYRNEIIRLSSGGGQPNISQEKVSSLKVSAPALNDQALIIAFLDHEIAKIDKLIVKQKQLIELLKEKRQAVISHAVTKGLNPDVPMKDSGVEWLGEIPSHWEMKRLAYLGSARNGLTYSPENITDQESGTLVLRSSNIQNSSLCFDDNVYVNSSIPEQFLVKENDLLICSRNGSRNLIGKNALISKDAAGMAFGAFMAIFRSQINTYIFWVLNSPLFDYQSGSFLTSTINQLTIGNLNSMKVPVPTFKEQKEIVRYLSKKNNDFIELINKVNNSIALLQERRTALISAAVTGKIDVRDWVAPDMQDAEEPQETTA